MRTWAILAGLTIAPVAVAWYDPPRWPVTERDFRRGGAVRLDRDAWQPAVKDHQVMPHAIFGRNDWEVRLLPGSNGLDGVVSGPSSAFLPHPKPVALAGSPIFDALGELIGQ